MLKATLFLIITYLCSYPLIGAAERVIITLRSDFTGNDIERIEHKFKLKLSSLTPQMEQLQTGMEIYWTANLPQPLDELQYDLISDPAIEVIEPDEEVDVEIYQAKPVNNVLRRFQWNLSNNGEVFFRNKQATKNVDIGLDVFSKTLAGSDNDNDVVVAVLDSGVDYRHPHFKDALAWNEKECLWNERLGRWEIPPNPTQDLDRNGYIGDCLGWNFAADNLTGGSIRNPIDEEGHGTHISAIIAGSRQSIIGSINESSAVKVLPLKVFSRSSSVSNEIIVTDSNGPRRINRSSIYIRAIDYAIRRNVDVINMSFGWPNLIHQQSLTNALVIARQRHNITIIAAAGNDSAVARSFPCILPVVICTGAVDPQGNIASYSNTGAAVDVYAPGDDIISAWPTDVVSFFMNFPGHDIYSGTSQAAAHISGISALLKNKVDKSLTADSIHLALLRLNSKDGYVNLTHWKDNAAIDPIITAELKTLRVIGYQNLKASMQFNLVAFHNLASDVIGSFSVTAKHHNKVIGQISQEQVSFISGARQAVRIELDLESSNFTDKTNQVVVEVTTSIAGSKEVFTFDHEVSLAKNLFNSQEVLKFPVEQTQPRPLTFRQQDMTLTRLRSIDNISHPQSQSDFYLPFVNDKERRLYFYSFNNDNMTFSEVGEVQLPTEERLKQVLKWNNIFIVITVGSRGGVLFENYYYLDKNSEPLFHDDQDFPIMVALENLRWDSRQKSYMPGTFNKTTPGRFALATQTYKNKIIPVPYFIIEKSIVPSNQFNSSDFGPFLPNSEDRVFYLNIENRQYMSVFDESWFKKMRENFQMRGIDPIELTNFHIKTENEQLHLTATWKMIIGKVAHYVRTQNTNKYYESLIGSVPIFWKIFEQNDSSIVASHTNFTGSIDYQVQQSKSGFITSPHNSGKGISHLFVLDHFICEQQLYSVALSENTLWMAKNGKWINSTPLPMLAFLNMSSQYDQQLIQRLFYKLPSSRGVTFMIDQTDLNHDHLSFFQFSDNGQIHIHPIIPTRGCRQLNPHYDSSQKHIYYQQICATGNQRWELQRVLLK